MPESVSSKPLRFALAAIAAISLAALLHTSYSASTPAAFELANVPPRLEGYSASLIATTGPIQGDQHSYGTSYQWEMSPSDVGMPAFRLQLMPMHSREWMEMSVEQIRRHASLPDITEHAETGTDTGNDASDRVVIGHSRSERVLQTCLVADGRSQVSATGLNSAVTEQVEPGMRRRVMHFLGLQPNVRWECLLVTISQPDTIGNPEALLHAWRISRSAINSMIPGVKSN